MKVNDRVTVKTDSGPADRAWYWQWKNLVKAQCTGFAGGLPARHLVLQ